MLVIWLVYGFFAIEFFFSSALSLQFICVILIMLHVERHFKTQSNVLFLAKMRS